MKTHSFKRWIAGLLSAALCLSAFLGLGITKAFAKGEQAEVCLVSFPREGDANYCIGSCYCWRICFLAD